MYIKHIDSTGKAWYFRAECHTGAVEGMAAELRRVYEEFQNRERATLEDLRASYGVTAEEAAAGRELEQF